MTRPNGQFQQWQTLLTNRTKRTQTGKFFVQGVRPINMALEKGLAVESLLYRSGKLSDWAKKTIASIESAKHYEVSAELLKQLSEKEEGVAEVLLIVKTPNNKLADVSLKSLKSQFILALDRPQNPGNVGAVVRSADALGAGLVIITGHAADIYDPKAVRASRGSLFALPIVIADSPSSITDWLGKQQASIAIVGLSEDGDKLLWDFDLTVPTLGVIGNETWGLSKQWKDTCKDLASVPMYGSASSLNAASSAAITLYEYSRQRVIQHPKANL